MSNIIVSLGNKECEFMPWAPAHGRVFSGPFAMDIETTLIDHDNPAHIPSFVIGAASDGSKGFFVTPSLVVSFLQTHENVPVVFHNASFDLKVVQQLAQAQDASLDVYARVEANQVWDTMLLHQLYVLATEGHTAEKKGQSTLEACSERYLGCELPKDAKDSRGKEVRLSYGQYLNQPPRTIEPVYLEYLAKDALATILVFDELRSQIDGTLAASHDVWGYVSREWLDEQIERWGPLTHHIQLKAAIVLNAITANGLCVDRSFSQQLKGEFDLQIQKHLDALHKAGFEPGEGSDGKLQNAIANVQENNQGLAIPRTPTGKYKASKKELPVLARFDPFFRTLHDFKKAQKLHKTYISKMVEKDRLHPRFKVLVNTGRTSSFGDINAQNLPRDDRIRRCVVPSPGHVFLDADYATIEMATLAQSLVTQFGANSQMAKAINEGKDLHTLVAAKVTGKAESEVTKEERSKAKPINFGKPGGMGTKTLQSYALESYEIALSEQEVKQLEQAWFELFPEMKDFLSDLTRPGDHLAHLLNLTVGDLRRAQGNDWCNSSRSLDEEPAGWLGGMCLKVLRSKTPARNSGEPYSPEECDYFWAKAKELESIFEVPEKHIAAIAQRKPSEALFKAVISLLDQLPVFTVTGRLRARASYTARHNAVFQGLAADGAKIALWNLWRAGFRIANFIHDQVLVEVPADADLKSVAGQVKQIMVESMAQVVPDVQVRVESAYRSRWSKAKEDLIK